jgi:uncharacterized protein
MHLALGNGEFTSLKVDGYAANERHARRMLGDFIAGDPGENPPSSPYPEPVEHCAICRWSERCTDRRRRDDDLSLIAGITAQQRRALKGAGVATRRGFAGLAELPELSRVSRASLLGAQLQARLQVDSEDAGQITYELLAPERDAAGALAGNGEDLHRRPSDPGAHRGWSHRRHHRAIACGHQQPDRQGLRARGWRWDGAARRAAGRPRQPAPAPSGSSPGL